MKIIVPEKWYCFKCRNINPSIKGWRKRREALLTCLKCGAKRQPVAL